jgi:hypothetical protein
MCNIASVCSEAKLVSKGETLVQNASKPSIHMGKIALASTLGATIEWYDFFLYGVMTALVFNKLSSPTTIPGSASC